MSVFLERNFSLEVVILKEGRVGQVRILQGLGGGLNDQAISCVRQWIFVPAKFKGDPVDVIAGIAVDFAIMKKTSEPTSRSASSDLKVDADLSGRVLKVKRNTAIYEEPTVSSKSLARLSDGETVRVIRKAEGNFWKVQYGDLHGFVHGAKLKNEIWDTEPALVFKPPPPTIQPLPANRRCAVKFCSKSS